MVDGVGSQEKTTAATSIGHVQLEMVVSSIRQNNKGPGARVCSKPKDEDRTLAAVKSRGD